MPVPRFLLRAAAIFFYLAFVSHFSVAAPSPGSYKALVERAQAAAKSRDFSTAAQLFAEAYKQSSLPEVLYQLGCIAVAEGRTLDAHDLFRRYLADPSRVSDDAATRTAEQLIAEPLPPFGSLSVLSDPGALVLVDDRLVGTQPLPLPLLLGPGEHKIVLEYLDKRIENIVVVQAQRLIELRMSRSSDTVLMSVLPAVSLHSELTGLPPEVTRRFGDTLEQAARGEHYTLLRADTLPAQGSGIDFQLRLRARRGSDAATADWSIELSLTRADIETPAAGTAFRCASCTVEQATARLKETAAKLFADGLSRPRGTLYVTAEPKSAEVRISGEPTTQHTPATLALWAGKYEVTLGRPGFASQQRSIEISDGNQTELQVQLARPGAASGNAATLSGSPFSVERQARPKWRLGLGGALIAVGAGLAGAGITGFALNGQCASAPAAEGGACARLYSTTLAGGLSVGAGAALVASGVVLLAVPGRTRKKTAMAAAR